MWNVQKSKKRSHLVSHDRSQQHYLRELTVELQSSKCLMLNGAMEFVHMDIQVSKTKCI